jgi:flavin reductase (DIM6/NTAB) family NADH-FMN oxidoreductase RutF
MTFDDVSGTLDYPMVVVTTAAGDARSGCLVGFHTQSSIEPARYAFWLSRANHTFRVALLAEAFAVHFLSDQDRDLAVLFGTQSEDDVDKFEQCQWHPGPDGVPILDGCATWIAGRRHVALDDGGDHVCFIVTPTASNAATDHRPLMFSAVRDLEAGHDSSEPPQPDR